MVAAKSCQLGGGGHVERLGDGGSEVRRRCCTWSWIWSVTIVSQVFLLTDGHMSIRGTCITYLY
ncbi:unnamed protein product, partial [Arabidopsis halleri]